MCCFLYQSQTAALHLPRASTAFPSVSCTQWRVSITSFQVCFSHYIFSAITANKCGSAPNYGRYQRGCMPSTSHPHQHDFLLQELVSLQHALRLDWYFLVLDNWDDAVLHYSSRSSWCWSWLAAELLWGMKYNQHLLTKQRSRERHQPLGNSLAASSTFHRLLQLRKVNQYVPNKRIDESGSFILVCLALLFCVHSYYIIPLNFVLIASCIVYRVEGIYLTCLMVWILYPVSYIRCRLCNA